MLHNPLGCQVQHPTQGIIIGTARLILRDLPELQVQAIDNIHRVYEFPNLCRIFKEGAQNIQVFFPTLDIGRLLLLPGITKLAQIFLRFIQCDGGIIFLLVPDHFLDVLIADILGGATDLMDNAAL